MNIRLVIDTNVFISAIISKHGFPRKILDEMVLSGKFRICFSDKTMAEILRVSHYPRLLKKYPTLPKDVSELLDLLKKEAIWVRPTEVLTVIKDDDDNRFLEVAVAAQAGFLITGNTNDFLIDEFNGIKIVGPREFYEIASN